MISTSIKPVQRFVIVCLIHKMQDGQEFKPENYPLHVTIVPSFKLPEISEELFEKIKKVCSSTSQFTLIAGEEEYFGPNKEVAVSPLLMNKRISLLHAQIADCLKQFGAEFDEFHYMYDNYRAHVTAQSEERLLAGDNALIDSVTIIDKLPNGNPHLRRLQTTISLQT